MFTRSHGLRIDKDGNLWTTDVGAHTVMKLSPKGDVLLTLGTKGKAGVWDEAAGSRLFNEPNDIAIAANGDLFITQGHTPGAGKGDPRVLKFDKDGKFIKTWGGKEPSPASSTSRMAWPSTPRACCGSPTAKIHASRSSIRTENISAKSTTPDCPARWISARRIFSW
jgi:hypothetical protein